MVFPYLRLSHRGGIWTTTLPQFPIQVESSTFLDVDDPI